MVTVSELKDLLKHFRIALTGKKKDELIVLARSHGLLDANNQPTPEALAAAKRRFWHKSELIDVLKATN
jgi:hypothetical protein